MTASGATPIPTAPTAPNAPPITPEIVDSIFEGQDAFENELSIPLPSLQQEKMSKEEIEILRNSKGVTRSLEPLLFSNLSYRQKLLNTMDPRLRSGIEEYTPTQILETARAQGLEAFLPMLNYTRSVDEAFQYTIGRVPDKEAKIQFYARMLNISPEVVEANLPRVEQEVLYRSQRHLLADSPKLAEWLTKDENISVAQDSIAQLAKLEGMLLSKHGSFFGQVGTRMAGTINWFLEGAFGLLQSVPEIHARIPGLELIKGKEGAAKDRVMDAEWAQYFSNWAELYKQKQIPLTSDIPELQRFAVELAGISPQLAVSVGSGFIDPLLPLLFIGGGEAGTLYHNLREEEISVARSATVAYSVGIINGALESMQASTILKMSGLKGQEQIAIRQAIGMMIENGVQESTQNLVYDAGDIVGMAEKTGYKWDEIGEKMYESAGQGVYEGLLAGVGALIFSAPAMALNYSIIVESRKQQITTRQAIEDLMKVPLAERSPEKTEEILDKFVDSEDAYIQARVVEEYFQADPDTLIDFLNKLGITKQEFDHAKLNNTRIHFKLSKWLTHVEKSQVATDLLPFLAINTRALTEAEIEARTEELVKIGSELHVLLTEAKKNKLENPEAARKFRDDLIKVGGFDQSTAERITDLYRAAGTQFAKLSGETTEQWANRTRPMIRFWADEATVESSSEISEELRGKTTVIDGRPFVDLFKTGDVSTVLHELGAIFLNETERLVKEGKADEVLLGHYKTLMNYANGELNAQGKETLLAAFEKYISEGRAPSVKLTNAFAHFAKWMRNIYARFKIEMTPDINDDLRDVFDQWLATEQDLKEAAIYYKEGVAVSDFITEKVEELKAARAKLAKAKRKIERVRKDQITKLADQRIKAWIRHSGGRGEMRKGIKERVNNRPIYLAIDKIKARGGISLIELMAYYPDTADEIAEQLIAKFGKNILTDKPGANLEAIAKEHGFESVNDLLAELNVAPKKVKAVTAALNYLIAEKHVEFSNELRKMENLPGDKQLHTDMSLDFILADMDVIAAQLKNKVKRRVTKATLQAIKDTALKELATQMSANDAMKYNRWMAEEAKQAQRAFDFAEEGNLEEAYEAMRARAYAFAMVQAAIEIRDHVRVVERRYKANRVKLNSVEADHRKAIYEIINHYKLNKLTKRPEGTMPHALSLPLQNFNEATDDPIKWFLLEYARGIPEWMLRKELPHGGINSFKDLSFDEILELDFAIKWLKARGTGALVALRSGRIKTREQFIEAALEQMKTRPDHKALPGEHPLQFVTNTRDWFFSYLVKMEYAFEELDGSPLMHGKPMGLFHKTFIAGSDCEADYEQRMGLLLYGDGKSRGLKALFEGLANDSDLFKKENGAKYVDLINGVPLPDAWKRVHNRTQWDYETWLSVLLHTGNDANLNYLTNSNLAFTKEQIDLLRSAASEEMMDAVQEIWDLINSQHPELKEVTYRLYNKELLLEKAQGFTVRLKNGKIKTYRGGYMPFIPDTKLNRLGSNEADEEVFIQEARKAGIQYVSNSPRHGWTHDRLRDENGKPLGKKAPLLSVGVLVRHLSDTIRTITHGVWLQEMHEITADPRFIEMYERKRGEQEYLRMREWLNYIARPERRITDKLSKVLEHGRYAHVISAIGGKFFTGLKQRLSTINGIEAMNQAGNGTGWKYFGRGAQLAGGRGILTGYQYSEIYEFVHLRSPSMASRARNFNREARDFSRRLHPFHRRLVIGEYSFSKDQLTEMAFYLVRQNDLATVYPLWLGAYHQAIGEKLNGITNEMNEQDADKLASQYADTIIRMSQPSAMPTDQPAIQRLEGGYRMMVALMTWKLTAGNRAMWYMKAWKNGEIDTKDAMRYFFLEWMAPSTTWMILPFLLYREKDRPDWYDFILSPGIDMVAWLPFIGTGVDMVRYRQMSQLPAYEGIEKLARTYDAAANMRAGKAVWELWRAMEWWAGVPVTNLPVDFYRKINRLDLDLERER